jgi:hypothetical protein
MSKRIRPTTCIVCGEPTIYSDAATNHPFGACWENRCITCGSDQTEDVWFAQLRRMPQDMLVSLQCPFVIAGNRCTQMHAFPLGDLLPHDDEPEHAQFRCPQCNTWGMGQELIRNNKAILKHIVDSFSQSEK